MKEITTVVLQSFENYLINEEKAWATIGKYVHDVGTAAGLLLSFPRAARRLRFLVGSC